VIPLQIKGPDDATSAVGLAEGRVRGMEPRILEEEQEEKSAKGQEASETAVYGGIAEELENLAKEGKD
jgi:hypothetical protein